MNNTTPIAVIGIGCRFPGGVSNPEEMWDLLSEGRSGWGEVPADRWNAEAFYNPEKEAKESVNCKSGYFLQQDVSLFDAKFFNIVPYEAHSIDPQQRLLLETTYEALENAGIPIDTLRGSDTSVFVGVYARDYDRMGYKDLAEISKHHSTGTGEALLSNRISYLFDLKGASMTIDTGCSASVSALHQACLTLKAGESRVSIVSGVELLLHPDQAITMSVAGMWNPDGRCFVFDERGSGYSRGEGVGTVILKRLDFALEDGDPVHAVILNSGLNQDGKTAGITQPNPDSQAALMEYVYESAGVNPAEALYVEAHGTGTQAGMLSFPMHSPPHLDFDFDRGNTSLVFVICKQDDADPSSYLQDRVLIWTQGDNAEISSISRVFCENKARNHDLYVGSVKSNIGHLEAASGIAGLIKTIMILKKGLIPPNLDFVTQKPGLKLDERHIKVPQSLIPLAPPGHTGPKRVSMNSFGYGGTNGHVILESLSDSLQRMDSFTNGIKHSSNTSRNRQLNPTTNGANGVAGANGINHSNGHVEAHTNGEPPDHSSATSSSEFEVIESNGLRGHAEGKQNGHIQTDGHSKESASNGTHPHEVRGDMCSTAQGAPLLFPLTAYSDTALEAIAKNLLHWLTTADRTSLDLKPLAYTLGCRRSTFAWRRAIVASSAEELKTELVLSSKAKASSSTNMAFVFTGQGSQWFGMGRELLATSSRFKDSIVTSGNMLRLLGAEWSLEEELSRSESESRIGQSEISQPSTTAVQIALVDLLANFGVHPSCVVGHSSGEIAAAYAAGALSHQSAIEISYFRGVFSAIAKHENNTQGSMLAVGSGAEAIAPLVKKANLRGNGEIRVACINSPESVTISGDEPAIDDLQELLKPSGTFARKLKVDTAYHSHHMEKISYRYLESLQQVTSSDPREGVRFFSSVTGNLKESGFSAPYWAENLVSPVRFSDALQSLAQHMTKSAVSRSAANLFLEIGPHSALQGPLRQTLSAITEYKYNYSSSLIRGMDASRTVLAAISSFFQLGLAVNLKAVLDMQGSGGQYHTIDDLAPYPFDHGTKYWRESRLSRDHRLRRFPYHDLLGVFDVSSSVLEPRWRYHLSVASLPWLKHHKVDGMMIFPGAGYLCMAIEAIKQLTFLRNSAASVAKYAIRNASFLKPIIVPDERSDGLPSEVEVQLVISRSKISDGNPWDTFHVYSYSDEGSWSEHCNGLIRAYLTSNSSETDEVEGTRESKLFDAEALKHLERITATAHEPVDPDAFYSKLRASGNDYGPTFSSISEIRAGKFDGYCKLIIPDLPRYMPSSFLQPHVIHPATLDIFSHVGCMLYKRECKNSTIMLEFIEEVVVSSDIANKPGDELLIATQIEPESNQSVTGKYWTYQRDSETNNVSLVCTMSGIQIRSTGEEVDESENLPFHRRMNYRLSWDEDVDFMTDTTFGELMASASVPQLGKESIMEQFRLHEKAAAVILQRFLASSKAPLRPDLPPHFVTYNKWIDEFVASDLCSQLLVDLTTEAARDELLLRSAKDGMVGEMLARIGNNLPAIFGRDVEPLDVMLKDDLLNKLYSDGLLAEPYPRMAKYFEALVFKKPHMRIIEVGAGTGGVTLSLLQALNRDGTHLLNRYHYTDISTGFFAQAKAKFSNWKSCIDFKALDITRDPEQQGFEPHSYDLVIASNVLHATPFISETLKNTRKLLKPGGRMLLLELTGKSAAIQTIFGTLPGWWAFEDGRKGSPLLTKDEWQDKLLQASFAGIEHVGHESGESPKSSMMVIKATDTIKEKSPVAKIKVFQGSQSALTQTLSHALCSGLEAKSFPVSAVAWDPSAVQAVGTDVYVVLDNSNQPILPDPSADEFEALKSLLTKCRSLLWVSFHESDSDHAAAMQGLVTGMARVVRRENEGVRFITLDVKDALTSEVNPLVDAILKVAETWFWPKSKADSSDEDEYAFSNARLEIPRIHTDFEFNKWVDRVNKQAKAETHLYQDLNQPFKLEAETPGLLSSLRFVHDELPSSPLRPDQIQIEALAYGINFRDVFIALGQMPAYLPMIGEVCGVVTVVGSDPDTQSRFKVGDRVAGLSWCPFSSYPRLRSLHARVVPDSITSVVAASIPIVYLTAYHSLIDIARLQKGQTILIHSASGGVGQAAIRIAQHIGAEIFATVGSATKRNFVMANYGIPESHIFSSRTSTRTFKQGIMRLTANKGVDVVLNSLAGEMLAESWECLAEFGTHLEIGKADIYKRSHLSMAPLDRSTTFAAIDLFRLLQGRAQQMWDILGKVFDLVQEGVIAPVQPLNILPMDQIEPAFRLISDRKHIGKVILEVKKDTLVKAILPPPSPLQLDPHGTYVIAGGLGDLGRRMCRLLASSGAGHIVTLSRHILDDTARAELEDSVRQLGGQLHIEKCDITDRSRVEAVAESCRRLLPPIKGIIHGGMVLRDRPFVHMKLEDYKTALGPKVVGTINLNDAFCSDSSRPDFFITLSSVSCIRGNLAQANYSAGNAFQDAFARANEGKSHTRHITLNVGAIDGSESFLAMPAQQMEFWRQTSRLMTFKEFYLVLEYAMSPHSAADGCVQNIMGFDRQAMVAAQDAFALALPLFSMLPYPQQDAAADGAEAATGINIELVLKNVKTMDEAVEHIVHTMVEKFAIFLDCPASDISLDEPFASFGMDSLVSIEMKNWMVRTFRAPMQSAEVIDAASIVSLATTLASRSSIIPSKINGRTTEPEADAKPEDAEVVSAPATKEELPSHGLACCRKAKKLPRQPIPDLDEALDLMLETISPFASNSTELENLCQAVKDFKKPGSVSQEVYGRLVEDANNPNVDNWLHDQVALAWLKRRDPVQFTSSTATHYDGKSPHTQSERAALIATTAFRHKQAVEAGTLEPDLLGVPTCTYFWDKLYNTCRRPQVGVDKVEKHSGNYCVVLRLGRVFKVPLIESGEVVSFEKMKSTMEAILYEAQGKQSWIGILTSDGRDSWAEKREALLAVDPKNAEYLAIISAAAFSISLDDKEATTNAERVRLTMFGDGFNRWYDKGLQFVVAANGTSSWIFDHAYIDGLIIHGISEWIQEAIYSYQPPLEQVPNGHSPKNAIDEVKVVTSPEIDAHMQFLRKVYLEQCASRDYVLHRMTQFGTEFLLAHGAPAKGIFNLLIQLASRLCLGFNLPSWEPVSLAHFHKGRIELIEYVSPPVVRFCASANDDTLPVAARREMMLEAARDINNNVKNCGKGKGFHRLLTVIEELWPQDEPTAALFKDPIWERITKFPLISNMVDGGNMDTSHPGERPDSLFLWMNYAGWEDHATFSIIGGKEKLEPFTKCLDEAGRILKCLVEAK